MKKNHKIPTTTQHEGTINGENVAHMEVTSKAETRDACIAMSEETIINVVTAMTLEEVVLQAQEQEDWELRKLIGKIPSDGFENDVNTIIKEQGPDTTMPQAIDIYVDNNCKQLGLAIWNLYKIKSPEEIKKSIDLRKLKYTGIRQRTQWHAYAMKKNVLQNMQESFWMQKQCKRK